MSSSSALRWDPCISHRRGQVPWFTHQLFAEPRRRCLLIAGAGFDPRTLIVPTLLESVLRDRLRVVLLRERRPAPEEHLLARAEAHIGALKNMCPSLALHDVNAFAEDGAVILGDSVLRAARQIPQDGITDVVVDWSALSIGGAFPLVKLLLTRIDKSPSPVNLHIMVVVSSPLDHAIVRTGGGDAALIRGYEGALENSMMEDAARLWVPQLRPGVGTQTETIYRFLTAKDRQPHDVMPILPFPAQDPRLPDRLLAEFYPQLQDWRVQQSSLAYAAEDDPLDLYRQLVRLQDLREGVFAPGRPSQVILSPLGSKLLAVGAMMAAVERQMPVLYVEAPDFRADHVAMDSTRYTPDDIVHLWLAGEAYPPRCASSS